MHQACHYDASSECAHVSTHSIAEVACYRLERALMGCRGCHQCHRINGKQSGWGGGVVTGATSNTVLLVRLNGAVRYAAERCKREEFGT